MKIKSIELKKILNSKNEETVEVTVNNIFKGSCGGDGVLNTNVKEFFSNEISINQLSKILNKGLYNFNVESLKDILEIENILLSYDRTNDLSKIGSSVLLALEFALLKLVSNNNVLEFLNKKPDHVPVHICNFFAVNYNEKKEKGQEIMLIPKGENFKDNVFANSYIYKKIKELIKKDDKSYDGSFISNQKIENILFYLEKITNEATKKLGIEFSFGLNLDSKTIFKDEIYSLGKKKFTISEYLNEINRLINRFDIEYLEDPLDISNINHTGKIKADYICGDRIFNGNLENIKKYAKYFNCALIKINEVGSLGRLKKIVSFCKGNDINIVLGQALGETNDKIVSEICVGFEFDFIKYNVYGKERILKLNELKKIEQSL